MKKRPISIVLISLVCILSGPFYLAYQIWFSKFDPLFNIATLSPLHVLIALMAIPVGIGIYLVKPWGYFSFLGYSVSLVGYFLFAYFTQPILHNYALLMASVLLVGSLSYLLQHHITAPYFNPKLRWWDRNPRYRTNLHAEFQIDGDNRKGNLLDLSLTGCYAAIDTRLLPGDTVNVMIRLLDHSVLTMAKVIWVNPENGGYGVMFTDLDGKSKKELKRILDYLVLSMTETGPQIDLGVPPVPAQLQTQHLDQTITV